MSATPHHEQPSMCDPLNDPSALLCGSEQAFSKALGLRSGEVVYVEHPEFGTVPTIGGRVCADFIAEAAAMGITVPEVLA